ncbi:MAG: large subunit ribosomal protein L25 [Microgenomates group bacterium Gr01-1014_16]|nr:MAG: large subunit ribosomal protein L25 [Microgenomates group bacterium Gr01-1014_16]
MTQQKLTVQPRLALGRKVKKLRAQGLIPANLFGKKIPSSNLQLQTKDFQKIYSAVGESTLLYLHIDGEKSDKPVMISEVTRHPVTGLILHVSFHQVDLKEKITAPVSVKLTGEAPAEKEKLGILVQQLDEIEVSALPANLPDHLDVDVSSLTEVDQAIYVKDLKLDSKLEIKSDPESIIAKIEPLAKEEVKEAAPEAVPAEGVVPSEVEGPPAPAAESKAEKK